MRIKLIAKTKPTKLGFRAQSILNFNLNFSHRPIFFFTCRVKLVYVQLDKFINFSQSYIRPKLLRLTCPTDFYLDHFYSDLLVRPVFTSTIFTPTKSALRPTRTFDQLGSSTKSDLRPSRTFD